MENHVKMKLCIEYMNNYEDFMIMLSIFLHMPQNITLIFLFT